MTPKIDWKLTENGIAHHTDQYSGNELVVRRGEPFSFSLAFDGAPPEAGTLTFTVDTGSTYALQSKTQVTVHTSSAPGGNSWSATQTSSAPGTMTFFITSPSNAAIGRYRLCMKTSASSACLGTFVLLFNPWLQGDEVYMRNNTDLEEYVLSESGAVFVGNYYMMGWNFGQFQDGILDICLSILDRSLQYRKNPAKDLSRRNDPIYVGRVLSAMINYNDEDDGVLRGNWSGYYSGGKHPSSWTGSTKILRKWKSSGFQPVLYGQCWVFAGVLTTVLRCLGFPARMITNYQSAHDTNVNLKVDEFYSLDGKFLERPRNDSIWNYHVWNEAWFTRSDLGAKYNGWQVLDATPQEQSEGIFQCGPASRVAIKEGDVDLDYEGPFIFAEVNADVAYWTLNNADKKVKRASSNTWRVGKFISTKAVGSFARLDVTNDYKYPEGTNEERETFRKARKKNRSRTRPTMGKSGLAVGSQAMGSPAMGSPALTMPDLFPDPPQPRVTGKFEVKSHLEVGQDVELVLQLTNLAPEPTTLTVSMNAWTIIYTGKAIHEVWKDSLPLTLGAKDEIAFPIKISYAAYQQHLTADNMIRVTAVCQVQEGTDTVVLHNICLENPTVTLKVPNQAKVGEALKVEMVFTNPLEEEISSGVLLAEANDILEDEIMTEVPPVKGKETVCVSFEVTPKKKGTKQLVTVFSCDKFTDVRAFELIKVVQ